MNAFERMLKFVQDKLEEPTDKKLNESGDKIRVAQISCDWKDSFSGREIVKITQQVGGDAVIYDYDQDEVDSKVMFISNKPLTIEQLDAIWNAGDLSTEDKDYWEGDSVEDIVNQLTKYVNDTMNEKLNESGWDDTRGDVAYEEPFVEWFMNGWNSLPPEEREDRLGDTDTISYEEAQNMLRNFFDEEYVKRIYRRFKRGRQFESKVNELAEKVPGKVAKYTAFAYGKTEAEAIKNLVSKLNDAAKRIESEPTGEVDIEDSAFNVEYEENEK